MSLTKASYSMVQGAPVNVLDYMTAAQKTAIMSGDTSVDCASGIQAAFDAVRGTYPYNQSGSVIFPGGEGWIYSTSGLHTLPEVPVIGENVSIKPIGSPEYVFKLDLRHTANTRRFCKDWKFTGFRAYTDRGFGVSYPGLDCDYFLLIDGGWIIRSEISYVDVFPGFACRSILQWDLTHPDIGSGVTEVGVPDAIRLTNISAHYAENTSYTIAFTGDELGTGSRFSSFEIDYPYISNTYHWDYVNRTDTTDDFGTIRMDTCHCARMRFGEIEGAQNLINMFNGAYMDDSDIASMYGEINYPRSTDNEAILRGGEYRNCRFDSIVMYAANNNLTAAPQLFKDVVFTDCEFGGFAGRILSASTNPIDANFINLGATSKNNTVKQLPRIGLSTPVVYPLAPWLMTKFSIPVDTDMECCEPYSRLTDAITNTISGTGEIVVATIPNGDAVLDVDWKSKVVLWTDAGASVTANIIVKGTGISNTRSSTATTLAASQSVVFNTSVLTDCSSNTSPDPTSYDTINANVEIESIGPTGATVYQNNSLQLQQASGEYSVVLNVTAFTGDVYWKLLKHDVGIARGHATFV